MRIRLRLQYSCACVCARVCVRKYPFVCVRVRARSPRACVCRHRKVVNVRRPACPSTLFHPRQLRRPAPTRPHARKHNRFARARSFLSQRHTVRVGLGRTTRPTVNVLTYAPFSTPPPPPRDKGWENRRAGPKERSRVFRGRSFPTRKSARAGKAVRSRARCEFPRRDVRRARRKSRRAVVSIISRTHRDSPGRGRVQGR